MAALTTLAVLPPEAVALLARLVGGAVADARLVSHLPVQEDLWHPASETFKLCREKHLVSCTYTAPLHIWCGEMCAFFEPRGKVISMHFLDGDGLSCNTQMALGGKPFFDCPGGVWNAATEHARVLASDDQYWCSWFTSVVEEGVPRVEGDVVAGTCTAVNMYRVTHVCAYPQNGLHSVRVRALLELLRSADGAWGWWYGGWSSFEGEAGAEKQGERTQCCMGCKAHALRFSSALVTPRRTN